MKNERGSIAVLAFVTVMFILIILATIFYSIVERSKAQVIEMEKLSEVYDGDMGEIYKERKTVQGIFVTLYSDGSLVFNNTSKLIEGKTINRQYGDIRDKVITSAEQIPWNDDKTSITKVDFASVIEPESIAMWFSGCEKLTELANLTNLKTNKLTSMNSMFEGCTSLTSLNLSDLNTSNITSMNSMFNGCTGLTSLDLSNFNTSNVTNMNSMFNGCTALTTIYVGSSWNTAKVTSSENMFLNCSSLVGGNSTAYDETKVDKEYAKIDSEGNAGYFTAK